MTNDTEDAVIEVFRMGTVDGSVSLRLPVSRARPLDSVLVLPDLRGADAEPSDWRPLSMVDASAPDGELLLTFPYAAPLADLVADRARWDGVPPMPLPDGGWRDVDQAWWVWLVVHEGWVFAAQTDFDAALDAMAGQRALTWSAPGRAQIGDAEVTWVSVPRPAWDDAWQQAVSTVRVRGA
jgi:hypothetical protein